MSGDIKKSEYTQWLKDPRWQKKRLEIMQRDGFRCKKCKSDNNTLHVHHKYYIYKKNPWDYPDELLVTLCEDCHQEEEDNKYIINDFTKVLLCDGYFVTQLVDLLKLIRQLPIGQDGVDYIVDAAYEYYKKSDNGA